MFQLQIADTDFTGGSIPVSWCIDVQTLKYLSDHKINDPQVVIITAPVEYSRSKEYRKIVPLKDLMAYIEFTSPGENRIFAFISERNSKTLKNEEMCKSNGRFISDILNYEGDSWGSVFPKYHDGWLPKMGSEILTVSVPEEFFAKEPSALEKIWVNHLFADKCVDQCEFRRRRLFAYTLQILWMMGNISLRAIFLVIGLLIGARKLSIKPLIHPLRYDFVDAMNVCTGGTIFFRHLKEDDAKESWTDWMPIKHLWYIIRKLCFIPLMPIILITSILLFVFATKAAIIITVIFSIILCFFFLATALLQAIDSGLLKNVESFFGRFAKQDNFLNIENIGLLLCDDKKPITFNTLPSSKKTVKLRIANLKAKICRPYSK
jgi:hypothetical protein